MTALVPDWGAGTYELAAADLASASARAVELAGVGPGDRVLDVACGTGNAALAAAKRGATVTGIDSAARLVAVAAERFPEGEWLVGDAVELPFGDGAFDAAISVFGVIFAQPAERAASELVRMVRPGGRIVVTAWLPSGGVHEVMSLMRRTAAAAAGADATAAGVDWSDPDTAMQLFAPHRVQRHVLELPFTRTSAAAWLDEQLDHHPVAIAARASVDAALLERTRREALDLLAAHNEDPAAFRATSRYVTIVVER